MRVTLMPLVLSGCAAVGAPDVPRHHLVRVEPPPTVAGGVETEVLDLPFPCVEALPSWNVSVAPGAGFLVELSVAQRPDGPWTPWLFVGEGGLVPDGVKRRTDYRGGRIDVDLLRAEIPFAHARLRVHTWPAQPDAVRVERLALCGTGPGGARRPAEDLPELCLPVPFRSQRAESPELAPRVCSPTALAMVLAYHGVERPTAEVAARVYDARHDLYGNWPRAVQAAFELGVAGYVTRFADWDEVAGALAAGTPLIASVRAGEGELGGAPYRSTEGHLIVVLGFDAAGDVRVNDPAAMDEAGGRVTYDRDELERAWLDRGGTAYVLLGPAR